MANSQMSQVATNSAQKKSPMLSAIQIPRNAKNAHKETRIATLLPSAPLPAESHTLNVIQPQANALLVNQVPIKTAPKPSQHVIQNAQLCHFQNAIEKQESAIHAQVVQVVCQLLHARIHAHQDQTQKNHGNAAGIQLLQNVFKTKQVPRLKKSAHNHAKNQHSVNATSLTTLV